jgi:hypothetical protein
MESTRPIRIGVSGKRQILPEEVSKIREEIRKRIKALLRHHRADGFVGYSALASGADTIFAQVVVREFHQPLQVVLPFAVEEYEKDFGKEDLAVFREWLGKSGPCEVAAAMPADNDTRDAGYFAAGKKIADECDEMIIVWDGLRPNGLGGTAEIVGYLSEKTGVRPVPFIKVKPVKPDHIHDELLHTYYHANRQAIRSRDWYKRVWKSAIFLGWMTVLCFSIKMAFHLGESWVRALTVSEFVFVAIVYILIFRAKRVNFHGRYLRQRMEAETCRLLRTFYHAGVAVEISDQSKEEGPVLAEMAKKVNRSVAGSTPSKWYTQYVIKSIIDEQCAYHNGKIKSIGNRHQVYEQINFMIGVAFIINLFIHMVHVLRVGESAESTWLYKVSILLNILFPATYAAFEGIIYFNEWALLRRYSDSAAYSLKEAEGLLPADLEGLGNAECHQQQAKVLHLISSVMLSDNRNWNLLLEDKDNYHMIV